MNGFKTVILMTAMMVLFILVEVSAEKSGMMVAFVIHISDEFRFILVSDKLF